MKRPIIAKLSCLLACACSVQAAVIVQNSGFYQDGNNGAEDNATVPFTISATNSILVVGVYVDASTPTINVTFNGLAPNSSYAATSGRGTAYVFLNPAVGTHDLFLDPTDNVALPGYGAIFYEVAGADLTTINVDAANPTTITTDTVDELVIGFAMRNSTTAPTLGASSIFPAIDHTANNLRGGGSIVSGHATAASPGSQNISWGGSDSRIAFSFDAAAVPEPGVFGLAAVGGLLFLRRRRRD